MQLNFAGLIVVALGIVLLGLGISGNYGSFGRGLKASATTGKAQAAGSSRFSPPTNPHTLQA